MKYFLEDPSLIQLEIFDVLLTEHGFNVVLQSLAHPNKALQILVGFADAHLLTIQFNKVRTNKPLIVDLMSNLFQMLETSAKFMMIYDIQDNQYSSRVYFENKTKNRFILESKTSDGLSLMMAFGGLIFVNKALFLKKAAEYNFYEEKGEEETQQYRISKLKGLKEKLDLAILEERYEEAGVIRAEMKKLEGESHD